MGKAMIQGIKDYEGTLSAASFAKIVAAAISQPDGLDINKVLFQPTRQEY
jgi:NADP-dependent 3-hydroxy acid dehydrogenase YdfG